MAMTTFSYVSTVLTQVNITKPCLIGGLSTGGDPRVTFERKPQKELDLCRIVIHSPLIPGRK